MYLASLLRSISMKHVLLKRTQTFMTLAGICLGVAAMVSIDVVDKSVISSFEDSINKTAGRAALQVTGAESGFPEAMLDRIQSVPGVEYALPVIETNAKLYGGSNRSLMILGVDSLQDHQIRNYNLSDDNADIPDPLMFLAKSDSILLTKSMAEREHIAIGQDVRVQTVQGFSTFKVRGLLTPEGPAAAVGGDIAVMDIYAAQMAFGKKARFDRVDVSFLRGENLDTMKERIQAALPEGYFIDTPAGRTRQIEIMLTRFRSSIRFISFMAMFVGMYLIYNAVSISVVQRRKEIGIMRALGGTRRQIISLFLGETFVISVLGSALGVAVGILFAKLSTGLVAQSVTDFYVKTSITEISYSWSSLAGQVLLGILASFAAALFPAVTTTRITPISAIRALPYTKDGFSSGSKMRYASLFFIVLSLLTFALFKKAAPSSVLKSPAAAFLSIVSLLLGISLVTPVILRRFLAIFHRFVSPRLGGGGMLAGLNLQKNTGRNAVAVAAIFYSIALFVSSACMIYSLNESILAYGDAVNRCDVLVSSGHPLAAAGSSNIPMPMELLGEIEKVPGVLSADPFRKTYVNYKGRRIFLLTIDIVRSMEYNPYIIVEGTRADIRRLLPDQDYVAVNEVFAAKQRVKLGDTIVLPTPNGPKQFGVAAIVVSFASDAGVIVMDTFTYRRHWQDNLADMFSVRLKPGADSAAVREAIRRKAGTERDLYVLSAAEFKQMIRDTVNKSFHVSNTVNILTLLIAAFGIVVTLLASVLERTRELGLLRAIGMRKKDVSRVIIIESVILGLSGGVLGAAVGILIGWIFLEGFFSRDMGSLQYFIYYAYIGWALALSAVISAVAGLYPALRAAKTNIVEALAYE